MHDEIHNLPDELPEHKEAIDALKQNNAHFARMFEEYNELNDKIYVIEDEDSPVSDEFLHDMKKRRLLLKDELYRLIQAI